MVDQSCMEIQILLNNMFQLAKQYELFNCNCFLGLLLEGSQSCHNMIKTSSHLNQIFRLDRTQHFNCIKYVTKWNNKLGNGTFIMVSFILKIGLCINVGYNNLVVIWSKLDLGATQPDQGLFLVQFEGRQHHSTSYSYQFSRPEKKGPDMGSFICSKQEDEQQPL